MAGDQPLKFPTEELGTPNDISSTQKTKPSTIKLEKTDVSKKSFYVPISWIKLKTCTQELASIVSADINVQSPVDILWSVIREQEICWQEINLKLPMEELRTPTHILNAGKKKKPSKSIKLDGKDIINTSYNVILQKSWNVEL